MSKAYTKIIITINLGKDGLVFGRHEVPNDMDVEAFLRDTYMGAVYLKLNKSFDIFNNITQAVIKATNGKKAFLPINQVDEIYVVNRLLLQTVSSICKLRIKESRVFYKPKHLKGILKDFKLDHVMSNDENKILQALRCPKPLMRKHIYGMPVTRQAIVGDKEIPIEPLTPADMEKMMKEAGVLKIKPGEDLNPFYSFISPARRTMFKEAAEELNRLLSIPNYGAGFVKTGYEASKCNYNNLDKMTNRIYPCMHVAVKEFKTCKENENKPGYKDSNAYFVVIATKDRVELVNICNIISHVDRIYFYTKQDTLVVEENIYDLGPIISNGDIGPNDIGKQSKKLTSDMVKYVLDSLPDMDKTYINRIVRICFTNNFILKYKEEKTDGEFFTIIDGKSTMSSLNVLPGISFSTVNKHSFVFDTHLEISRLNQKGEI